MKNLNLLDLISEDDRNHSYRVAEYARAIAKSMRISEQELDDFYVSCTLHDVGKSQMPQDLLNKADTLTRQEFEILKQHTIKGATLIKSNSDRWSKMAQTVALTHHERFDGRGYPYGLKGHNIPQMGRICAVADVYDALRSIRAYKKAWSHEEAILYIRDESGKHFDPQIVKHFFSAIEWNRHEDAQLKRRYETI